ncbi:TlpA family protein disulfide reductase [Streptobacillus canis]|uniref:TlpA family protein disulfide reductase n=1 Tax=Streptobacillus canis TaxID=2678686 RepID=UPI0012E12BAD|nr:TlpA family protein disulfide reductase [Streptobacillus canis]
MKRILLLLMMIFTFSCFSAGKNEVKVINNTNYETIVKKENNIIVYAAAWCPHCQEELENLSKIQDKLKNTKITVIMYPFIRSDKGYIDYEKETLEYINEKKYNFEFYLDKDREILEKLNLTSVPAVGVVKNGEIIKDVNVDEITIEKLLEIFGG